MQSPKVVVVTGASSGVGRATALAFARGGASVGLIARGVDGLEAARREIEAIGGRALALPLDVADAAAVEAAAERVERELGPIDVWVNNAMVSVFAPVAQMTAEEFRRVTEVNYLGFVHGTLSALRRMSPRDRGTIVQVGSALAYRAIPLQSAYCATKHAIAGFTDSLRCELLHDKSSVRITMVDMPALNTPHFDVARNRLPQKSQPVPPIFQPEVAANAIVHAAGHHRRQWFVGTPTVVAIFAQAIVPGLLDRYLGRYGYESQYRGEPETPGRPDNLWQPLPGDRGAHGSFDRRSSASSPQLWADQHRGWLVAAAVAGVAGVGAWLARRKPRM